MDITNRNVAATITWGIYGIPTPQPEYQFHPDRKFRFDWAWPDHKIAVEQEGGIWRRGILGAAGAHSRPQAILRDLEKYNIAAKLGWRVFRFTPQEIRRGIAQSFMLEVFQ